MGAARRQHGSLGADACAGGGRGVRVGEGHRYFVRKLHKSLSPETKRTPTITGGRAERVSPKVDCAAPFSRCLARVTYGARVTCTGGQPSADTPLGGAGQARPPPQHRGGGPPGPCTSLPSAAALWPPLMRGWGRGEGPIHPSSGQGHGPSERAQQQPRRSLRVFVWTPEWCWFTPACSRLHKGRPHAAGAVLSVSRPPV